MSGTTNNRSQLAEHFRHELVGGLRQRAAAEAQTGRRPGKLPHWIRSPFHRLSASLLLAAGPLSVAIANRIGEV